jgi:hypothetical protein
MPPVPGFRCLTLDLRVQKKTITGGFPGAREPAARKPAHSPEADGRAGRGARRTRSGRAFPFAPVRVGASIIPSDIQLDISAFLAVPPQNYGTDVQFQMPPVHTVFPAAALELSPATASTSCPRAQLSCDVRRQHLLRRESDPPDSGLPGNPRCLHCAVEPNTSKRRRDHARSTQSSATPDGSPCRPSQTTEDPPG